MGSDSDAAIMRGVTDVLTELQIPSDMTVASAHRSPEPGHAVQLRALGLEPLLDLGMRLGEGSGAALALPLLAAAAAVLREMATFAGACVSGPVAALDRVVAEQA